MLGNGGYSSAMSYPPMSEQLKRGYAPVATDTGRAVHVSIELGTGYGHVAFTVDNLDAEHARMTAAGVKINPIKEFNREGALMARFFFIEDPDGYKIEVLQRHGRYR